MWLFDWLTTTIPEEDKYSYVPFTNDVEKALFLKYVELGERNWWTVTYRMVKDWNNIFIPNQESSHYNNRERIYIHIIWVDECTWTAYREWDNGYEKSDWKDLIFDVIENHIVVKHLINIAVEYQDKQDAITKALEKEKEERERIEMKNKEEQEILEKYTKRISELNWIPNEFNPQFKILREIENIWKLNVELMDNWKSNIDKIYKLRNEFYKL